MIKPEAPAHKLPQVTRIKVNSLLSQSDVVRGLLLHLISLSDTHTHTHTRTPLDDRSARRRDLYLTRHSQETDIHVAVEIRTRNPSRRPAADALEGATTGVGLKITNRFKMHISYVC